MFRRVYLDNSATTPVDPRVVDAMLPFLKGSFGNASSIHFFGQEARSAVDKARHQVAELINARPNEIIFTSGGTESDNLAVRGFAEANERHGKHIVTSAIEHPAVKNTCEDLEKQGFEVTYLPVYDDGVVRIKNLIGDAVIDRRQPGGIQVAQPGRLHRRGLEREYAEAIVARVPREVYQDVDLIRPNLLGDFRIR